VAIGDYVYETLGTTTAGTEVGVWYLAGDRDPALAGTAQLTASFDWLERTYGAYTFGAKVAAVAAAWGPGAFGGMEHHPYWHVARGSMSDRETQAHEAAHGWFGNGVRMRCWEDFVLSEGLASYLAARAIEETEGALAGDAAWQSYQNTLDSAVASKDTLAWPATCNEIMILYDPLWSSIPYMKGAFFMRAVEAEVGRAQLDAVLASFYQARVGTAAGMQDLIDAIATGTAIDPIVLSELVDGWLRSLGTP
jgi:aminopeptidase N